MAARAGDRVSTAPRPTVRDLNSALALSLIRADLGGTTREWLIALLEQTLVALQYEPAKRLQWTAPQAIARARAKTDLTSAIEALEGRG